jgi:hypothetical protein
MSKKQSSKIEPPEHLWQVLIEPGGGYGRYPYWEKFWKLKKFDQELSNRYNEVHYREIANGIAITPWGLKQSIRKAYKKHVRGYTGRYLPISAFVRETK